MSTSLKQSPSESNTHTPTRDHNGDDDDNDDDEQPPTNVLTDDGQFSTTTTTSSPVSTGRGDRKARKKDQNRRAAFNYRRKKSEEKNRLREEEMRLVYSRVCLVGYADQIEGLILYILNTKTRKTLDADGNIAHFICPLCQEACDNILDLRAHLRSAHQSHEYDSGADGTGGSNSSGNNYSELESITETCSNIDDTVNNSKLD